MKSSPNPFQSSVYKDEITALIKRTLFSIKVPYNLLTYKRQFLVHYRNIIPQYINEGITEKDTSFLNFELSIPFAYKSGLIKENGCSLFQPYDSHSLVSTIVLVLSGASLSALDSSFKEFPADLSDIEALFEDIINSSYIKFFPNINCATIELQPLVNNG